jgi:hypothetical protein
MQNIRCLISLDEEYGVHGSGSISAWDKERRLRHPSLPSCRKWEAMGGSLTNYTWTIINTTLLSKNFFSAPNFVRVIKSRG